MTTISLAFIITTSAVFLTAFSAGPVSSPSPSPESDLSPAFAPAGDCLTSLLNLSDCLDYVTEGSNETVPAKACCPELAGLVDSNPICLCQLFGNTTDTLGIQIDVSRALKLPTACGVSTPPASLCPGAPPPDGSATENNDNGALHVPGSALACLIGFAIAFFPTFC